LTKLTQRDAAVGETSGIRCNPALAGVRSTATRQRSNLPGYVESQFAAVNPLR
jgi:hypothetical protein